jgi:hypothetical protein
MNEWIAARELAEIAAGQHIPRGRESLTHILAQTPELLLPVAGPASPPLDVATYRVRYERWRQGKGPALRGIENFVSTLETMEEPMCAISITGDETNYVILLDDIQSRIVAAVAIDKPEGVGRER